MAQLRTFKSRVRPVILMTHAILGMLVSVTALAQIGPARQGYAAVAMSNGQNPASGGLITPTFLPVEVYDSGGFARAAAVADLNADGKADVVTANNTSNNIGVLMGNGDGTLQPVVTYASGGKAPASIAVADLNGDGRPDLAVGICLSGSPTCGGGQSGGVAVLLGNGDGTFQPPTVYASGGWGPDSVVVADVNGDNKPDVLVTNFYEPSKGGGSVGVLIGIGDGTFEPLVTYGLNPPRNIAWIAVGDVNSDNKVDLVVAKSGAPNGIGVLLGNGDGTFQPDVAYNSGGMSIRVTVADVNSDGKLDLVVGNYDNSVGVMLGNGDGTFEAARIYDSGGNNVRSLAAGDLNGDGKPDVVIANCGPTGKNCNVVQDHSVLGILLGNGDGGFQFVISYDAGVPSVESLLIADMNGDGKPDLLGTCVNLNCGGGAVGVLLNNSVSVPSPTTTKLVSSLNPSLVGQAVTFTATVSTSAGAPRSGVTITFKNGSAVLGTAMLSSGMASLTTSSLAAGIYNITASYPGDVNFAASTSPGLRQVINFTTKSATTTTLVSSLNPSVYGQKVTWTATVTTTGTVASTGNVVFNGKDMYGHTFVIGRATLDSSGVATLIKSNLNANVYQVTAVYLGDVRNQGSRSSVLNQVVRETTSRAVLHSSRNPATRGQVVTFTATITSPTVTPTGPVTFTVEKQVLGTAQIVPWAHRATLAISALPVGSTVVTVTYPGDSNIAKSSASLTQTVQ